MPLIRQRSNSFPFIRARFTFQGLEKRKREKLQAGMSVIHIDLSFLVINVVQNVTVVAVVRAWCWSAFEHWPTPC